MRNQTRRDFLKTAAIGAVGINLFHIGHSWAQDAYFDGEPFDGKGATLRVSGWGGFWENLMRELIFDEFERTFNCKIVYDSSFPWAGKFLEQDVKNPPLAISNWNLPDMFRVAEAGDYFVEQDEIIANLPNIKDCWPFALSNGVGVTWAFSRLCYSYHNKIGEEKPRNFGDLWDSRFHNQRISVMPENDIFKCFFMTTATEFGASQRDYKTAIDVIKNLAPIKKLPFSRDVQVQIEEGQCKIGIQADAEAFTSLQNGKDVGFMLWENQKTILTQTQTISKHIPKIEKMLSYALLNKFIDESFFEQFMTRFPLRPMNANVKTPEKWAQFGIQNSFEETDGLWIPNWVWWRENEKEILSNISNFFVDA